MKQLAVKTLLGLAVIGASTFGTAAAARFCTRSYWVTMGGERVKVCCAQGLCTTKYGIYNGN